MNKSMSFEEAIKKLEKIVEELEKGDIPLEKSIKLFEEGMKLSKFCNEKLNEIETKIKIITGKDKNGPILEDF